MNITLKEQIDQNFTKLNATDMIILNYITENKAECSKLTIEALAAKCAVSRTTVMRFAQTLGFGGFSELKSLLKWECLDKHSTFAADALEIVCKDYRTFISEVQDRDFNGMCELIYKANNIYVYGTGAVQNNVARELTRLFLFARKAMCLIDGGDDELGLALPLIRTDDLVIIVSLSGETRCAVNFAKRLNSENIPLLTFTRFARNSLAQLSTQNLYVSTSVVTPHVPTKYETTGLFFMTVEMLLVKYLLYVQNLSC